MRAPGRTPNENSGLVSGRSTVLAFKLMLWGDSNRNAVVTLIPT